MGIIETLGPKIAGGIAIFAVGVLILIALAITGAFVWWYLRKKKWNMNVVIRLPRDKAQSVYGELAKGYWDADRGSIIIKRPGRKEVGTRPIDPKKWLQGSNLIEVIQAGPEDFIVSLPDSYKIIRDEKGNQYAIMDIIADIGARKAWKHNFERSAKNAFTLKDFLDDHKFAIELGIVLFCMCLGFVVIYMRLPSICA